MGTRSADHVVIEPPGAGIVDAPAISKEGAATEWRPLVAALRESGLSVKDFAASRGVPAGRLSRWRRRFGGPSDKPAATARETLRLVPVDSIRSAAPVWPEGA